MKFFTAIDDDIQLTLLHTSLAEELFNTIDAQRDYLSKWLPWLPLTKSVSDTKTFIKSSLTDYAQGKSMVCAIEYRGQLAGVIAYNSINLILSKVEIGYWLGENLQGKGIITRSCQFLIQHAFNEIGVTKVQISVASENLASRKVCERLNMHHEGTIKNSENLHGRIIDHAIYSATQANH